MRYPSGYIQDFDLDVFEHLRMVDYGDADIPESVMHEQTAENVLAAQAAVEAKVNDALRAGAVPVVLGQNSPCGSFAIAKPCSEHVDGPVGCVSLDTHWDARKLDPLTGDPRIAGSSSWKHKMYEFLDNMHPRHLVEIGERGHARGQGHRAALPARRRPFHQRLGAAHQPRHRRAGRPSSITRGTAPGACTSISTWIASEAPDPRQATSWASWPSPWA